MDLMGVSGKDKAKIGVKMLQNKKIEELSDVSSKILISVARSMIHKLIETLLPCDGQELMKDLLDTNGFARDEIVFIETALKYRKTGSLEKKLIRCVAAGNLSRKEAIKLILRDVSMTRVVENEESGDAEDRDSERIECRRRIGSNVGRMFKFCVRGWKQLRD